MARLRRTLLSLGAMAVFDGRRRRVAQLLQSRLLADTGPAARGGPGTRLPSVPPLSTGGFPVRIS